MTLEIILSGNQLFQALSPGCRDAVTIAATLFAFIQNPSRKNLDGLQLPKGIDGTVGIKHFLECQECAVVYPPICREIMVAIAQQN